MTGWLIVVVVLLGSAGLAVAFLYLRRHRGRQQALQLRLLAGRSQLLGEEIGRHVEALDVFDQETLVARRQEAENALNQLHVLLIERQAHLLNCEDLVHLQQHKINHLRTALEDHPPLSGPDTTPGSSPAAEEADPQRARNQIEDELLSKINQLRTQDEKQTRRRKPPQT